MFSRDVHLTATSYWHYLQMGNVIGPVTGAELWRQAAAGELSAEDHVRSDTESGDWIPAREVRGLFNPKPPDASSPPLPVPHAPAEAASPEERRRAASRAALLLLEESSGHPPQTLAERRMIEVEKQAKLDEMLAHASSSARTNGQFPASPKDAFQTCNCCKRRPGRRSRFFYGKLYHSGKTQVFLRSSSYYGDRREGTLTFRTYEIQGCHDSFVCWLCVWKSKLLYSIAGVLLAFLMMACLSGLEYLDDHWLGTLKDMVRFLGFFLYAAAVFMLVCGIGVAITSPFTRRSKAADRVAVDSFTQDYRAAGHDSFFTRSELAEMEFREPNRYTRVWKDYPRSRDPNPSPQSWLQWLRPRLIFVGCVASFVILVLALRRWG